MGSISSNTAGCNMWPGSGFVKAMLAEPSLEEPSLRRHRDGGFSDGLS